MKTLLMLPPGPKERFLVLNVLDLPLGDWSRLFTSICDLRQSQMRLWNSAEGLLRNHCRRLVGINALDAAGIH